MDNFDTFNKLLQTHFTSISKYPLVRLDVNNKTAYQTYITSFLIGDNPIYRERTEHDCSCCKAFIYNIANLAAIIDNKIVSIWDFEVPTASKYFAPLKALKEMVLNKHIVEPYLHYEPFVGTAYTFEKLTGNKVKQWNHFSADLPSTIVKPKANIPTLLGKSRSLFTVSKRAVEELTPESVSTILELIADKNLYRGEEHRNTLLAFQELQNKCIANPTITTNYLWTQVLTNNFAGAIRNTVIGSLLQDLSDGKPVDIAVTSFEKKVAGDSYKRPKKLVTKAQIQAATKYIIDNDLVDSLERRHATISDISITNVLHANSASKDLMKDVPVISALSSLLSEATVTKPTGREIDITIEDFLSTVAPNAESIEVLLEHRHKSNMMNLVAPVHPEAPSILAWNNNFTLSYTGGVADSMKEQVKAAGGNVEGDLRFSLRWNESNEDCSIDLDAHLLEPNGNLIKYSNTRSSSGAFLDVDNTNPGRKVAVENITYPTINKSHTGIRVFKVHNYSSSICKGGFTAQVEYKGEILNFEYRNPIQGNATIDVITCDINNKLEFKVISSLSSTSAKSTIYNISTQEFHKVTTLALSPNFWESPSKGNKHYCFFLENCRTDEPIRGFFNEFLNPALHEERRVFDVLATKMQVPPSDNQMAGLGFSSTKRATLIAKVNNQTYNIQF